MAELLAPAGNPEALDAAIAEGADAVYLGLKSFNARMRSSNFAWSQFEAAIEALHKRNKKIYVTVNTVVTESETERLYRFLKYLNTVRPDGLIVQDLGLMQMVHTYFPQLKIHASTQMNIASAKSANALSKWGVSRVVLARELTAREIADVHLHTSCELEVFVHGALCVSESGLCMFSSYLGGKSANRGMCTQACRRLYSAHTPEGDEQGYFFSPSDLQLIEHIPQLVQAGVASFKIEGRMKSAEYVGAVVSAYRYVLDNWQKDERAAVETAKRILANDFARSKTTFWIDGAKADEVLNPHQAGGTGIYLGRIAELRQDALPLTAADGTSIPMHSAALKGASYTPLVGDSIRLHKKDDTGRESFKIQEIKEEGGKTWIQIPAQFGKGDSVYLLQTKAMTKRYPQVLPKNLGDYRRQPADEKLPAFSLAAENPAFQQESKPETGKSLRQTEKDAGARKKRSLAKKSTDVFPEGFYVQVSSMRDVHAILADKPVRIIINLNEDTWQGFKEAETGKPLPFVKSEIFIALDPFLPQAQEAELQAQLEYFIENGYRNFVVNNPGHITLLKNKNVQLIAGPYLYVFNRYAAAWLQENGIYAFIPPIENAQENLESCFAPAVRHQVLQTVFSYPALFRMRFTLPKSYNFLYFSDKQEQTFRAFSTPSASFVLPEKPFAITDRIAGLRKKGFSRFLIDFSHTSIERANYRTIMQSCRAGNALPDVSRFNWKEGFYDPQKVEELKKLGERTKKEQQQQRTDCRSASKHRNKAPASAQTSFKRREFSKKGGKKR
ncbi:peptidase U32 family protein [Treponema phagedenis]|uniref:U32 family peptidase n=1 Tax=Treponema phagedenis TaxID=162 RepID=A0AAE6IWZ2_TREPH|nr:peptidase U32 family protein [Treponema phagedenis]NVP24687.1 U32 family peptidase [Treponema phagedenis]QEJ95703.1 U32 family peptidase [Treponema phagedenis]QEJ98802.1 U32 family peptidase [Treponema phagedenis]QEK00531.1 U32 family peptidase [Treponema phagedenis]QEK04307.1 U32 family peptidase [Treponema phagedenis]